MSMSAVSDKLQYRKGLPYSLHVDYVPFYDLCDPDSSLIKAV